jgi:uncharacterized protein (DUF2062 family)
MLIAAILAVYFRVNIPVAAVLVWVSNPVTIPPMFYSAYKLGAKILHHPPIKVEMHLSLDWLMRQLADNWLPMLVGCLIFAVASSLLGYASVRLLWRLSLVRKWQQRSDNRQRQNSSKPKL